MKIHPLTLLIFHYLRYVVLGTVLLLITHGTASAQTYPAPWPSDSSWITYTKLTVGLQDLSTAGGDQTDGGTGVNPDSADVYNGDSGTLPSVYYYYDATNQVLFFRMRLRGDPRQGGSGSTNLQNATWNALLDTDGDGYREFFVEVNGNNSPDNIYLYYSNASRQDIPSGYTCAVNGEGVVWSQQITLGTHVRIVNNTATGGGYFIDYQVPLSGFKNCSNTQALTPTTPFALAFSTSQTTQNPTQKDLTGPGDFEMAAATHLPSSDVITLGGGITQKPQITDVSRTCGGGVNSSPITLTATTLDTLDLASGAVVDTINNVKFYYSLNGTDPYTLIAQVNTTDIGTVNSWSTQWTTSSLAAGTYYIKVEVTDDQGNTASNTSFSVALPSCTAGTFTVPVTLSYFCATRNGRQVRFEWSTATEVGNVGFNLYVKTKRGLRRINDDLIASRVVDSVDPQDYSYDADLTRENSFFIEDVDITGESKLHGPFKAGKSYGERVAPELIDWQAIRAEHEAKDAEREARREASEDYSIQASSQPGPLTNLLVDRDGLYRITYEQLFPAKGSPTVPVSQISLMNRGVSVQIFIGKNSTSKSGANPSDQIFGPGSYIEFYGEALNTLYTRTNVYTLCIGPAASKLIRTDDTTPNGGAQAPQHYMESMRVERNRIYSAASPNGDPWFDTSMLAYKTPVDYSFNFDLEGLVRNVASANVKVDLWGVTNFPEAPDHHVIVQVNNQIIANDVFDGLVNHPAKGELSSSLLQETGNTLKIQLPGDTGVKWDVVYFDGFTVTYPRSFTARDGKLTFSAVGEAFRVDSLPTPNVVVYRQSDDGLVKLGSVRVEKSPLGYSATFSGHSGLATYFVSTVEAITSPAMKAVRPDANIKSQRADYLIISHPNFISGLQPLVQARQNQGLSVKVVNVEDVYAQFNYGIFDPQPIRDYIAHAVKNLGTRYVLLVGGDTYDYLNNLGQGAMSFIPSLYARTGSIVSFAPVDTLFADVNYDGVPDVAIGRFPVRTSEELDSIISKTLKYSGKTYSKTAVFAADKVDGSISFAAFSETLIEKLPLDWQVQRAYIDDVGVTNARNNLVAAINSGVALTSFFGHSGPTSWTFSNLFSANDAASLTNADRPTVVMQWGCWNTYYVSPLYNTLGHKFMLSGNRGAAAVAGAATLTEASSEAALGRLLNPKLAQPGMTIGAATLAAKKELAATHRDMVDVILGWTLLGDPALVIQP